MITAVDTNVLLDVFLIDSRGTWASNAQGRRYGFGTFGDYFTPRQLVALTSFSDLVGKAIERVKHDYLGARTSNPFDKNAGGTPALPDDDLPLRDGGTGATAYAEAVGSLKSLICLCRRSATVVQVITMHLFRVSQRTRSSPPTRRTTTTSATPTCQTSSMSGYVARSEQSFPTYSQLWPCRKRRNWSLRPTVTAGLQPNVKRSSVFRHLATQRAR